MMAVTRQKVSYCMPSIRFTMSLSYWRLRADRAGARGDQKTPLTLIDPGPMTAFTYV